MLAVLQILKALGLRVATMPQYQVVMEVQKLKAEADRLRAEVETLSTTLRFGIMFCLCFGFLRFAEFWRLTEKMFRRSKPRSS